MLTLHGFRRLTFLTLLCVLCVGASGCGSQGNVAAMDTARPPENNVVMASSPTATPAGLTHPTRLVIPALDLNAPVEEVGMLPNGDLAVPTASPWVDAGWYSQGPRPGEQGSVVIDGHLDQPGGLPAVFWRLRELRKGNEVQVIDSAGQMLRFRVTDVQYYTPQNAPLQAIFGNSSGKYLNLITCAGDWIPNQRQTTLRLVVYTTLMSE